jgi:PAS domain-containing protein
MHMNKPAVSHEASRRAFGAERRLADFANRKGLALGGPGETLSAVFDDLETLTQELQSLREHLNVATSDLTLARQQATDYARRYAELHELLPQPCVLTDEDGSVDSANALASTLFNVGQRYLAGKPLLLYLPEREQYFRTLDAVRLAGNSSSRMLVRPRERKPRILRVSVSALPSQLRWCWIFQELE